ncbi:MAG: acylneuraminate cytidylyltransferase family protein [Ignavibacteriae bacterium]|nr:acylneuraminate cytidylyltransferase family protein [Ignavibacteriota bacterium]
MKIVAFTPSRLNSQRVPQKNIKMLGRMPLVNYALETMNRIMSIDEIVIFASESSICNYIRPDLKYRLIERPAFLDTQEAKVQDLIREFLKANDADIILMFHLTSPFLRPETVDECIEKVRDGEYDSAFTAFSIDRRCWFKGRPLNFSSINGNTGKLEPVIVEHSLYIFRRKVFETTGRRISVNPYIKIVDQIEGHDIDTPEDFRIAELIVNTGLFELK